jgi:phosphate acetyltransferase
MSFADVLRARAAAEPRRILFPESNDARTLAAVRLLAEGRIVEPILVGGGDATAARDAARALGLACLDPVSDPHHGRVTEWLWERRRAKGVSEAEAEARARDPLYFADALVALGEGDGCVAGAVHTTADVMHAALWAVGLAPGVQTVSSAFYMVVRPFRDGAEEVLTFADCAVVPEPSSVQLADTAIAAARDRRRIVGDEPRVAFLSYSTVGSAEGPSIERVRAAVRLVRERAPDLAVEGELQGDAALIPSVAERKAPGRAVAGLANVLIFPSLDAGNIAYKLVERIAQAHAIGPIVQGLARPCSDLSRGASIDAIINVACVTALQARGATRRDVGGLRLENHQ